MMVELPHGMCVNPEIVKLIHVRMDRQQRTNTLLYSVVIKTDDDGFLVIATLDDRGEADTLAAQCADLINTGLGEEPGEYDESSSGPSAPAAQGADADADADDADDADDLDW